MEATTTPLRVIILSLAGWLNREQAEVLEYLRAENAVLRQQLGKRRLRLSADQCRRLAVLGKGLGRRLLRQWASIATPDTILAWHRRLIALKWTYSTRGPGRPGVMRRIVELTVQMTMENRSWGYGRLQGALSNLGHTVARTTMGISDQAGTSA